MNKENKNFDAAQAFEEKQQDKDKPKILSAMTMVLYDDLSFDILPKSEINGEEFGLNPNALPDFVSHLKKINDKVNVADALSDMVQVRSQGDKS